MGPRPQGGRVPVLRAIPYSFQSAPLLSAALVGQAGRRLEAGLDRGVRRRAGPHALYPVRQMQQFAVRFIVEILAASRPLADLPQGDALTPQQGPLTLGDVLIQDVHSGRDSKAYSAA